MLHDDISNSSKVIMLTHTHTDTPSCYDIAVQDFKVQPVAMTHGKLFVFWSTVLFVTLL